MMENTRLINFEIKGDHKGRLVAFEENRNIPFEIKRTYFIYATSKQVSRGFHAHKNLEQVLVVITGSCDVLLDNGTMKETVTLSNPRQGLYIKDLIWHEMSDFSSDCVLAVLASDFYNEGDYVRDYDLFMELVHHE